MDSKSPVRYLCAAAMAGLSLQAQALVQAQAEITQVQWTIVDLTPGDGIPASIDVSGLGTLWQAVGWDPWTNQTGNGALGSGTGGSVSTPTFSADAQIAAGMPSIPGAGPAGFVSGSAQGGNAVTYSVVAVFEGDVTLGANTGIVLTARTDMSAVVGLTGERATGSAGVFMFRPDHPNAYIDSLSTFEAFFDHTNAQLQPVVSASFDNVGDTSMVVHIGANAMIQTFSVSAVPEPSTLAMMLAGCVGLLGVFGRRT